jgi:hypothetical protein
MTSSTVVAAFVAGLSVAHDEVPEETVAVAGVNERVNSKLGGTWLFEPDYANVIPSK